MRYASRPDNLREIAKQLGVANILEGSVQRDAGAIRVNVQLIEAENDSHLWAETYDRDIKNVFSVESEVAQNVADALKATLLPAESARITNVPTKNPAAYDLFLKAQYLFSQLQNSASKDPVTDGKAAVEMYRRAIAADPDFALACARLSYLQSYLHWYGVDNSSAVIDDAQAAAEQALALQPDLPEAHLAMGYVHYWGHRDYAAALREFAIAQASLPNDAEVVAAIGYVHRRQGIADRGVPELQQAMVLDPRNSLLPREVANSYTALRRYAEADAAYARSLAIFPGDIEAQEQRAASMMYSGDTEAAARILGAIPADTDPQGSVSLLRYKLAMTTRQPAAALAAIAHAPDWLMTRWEHSLAPLSLLRGEALALKGEADAAHAAFLEAEKELQSLLDKPHKLADAQSYLGLVYAGLGQKEAALKSARAAVDLLPMSRDVIVGAFYLERLARVEARVGETQSAIDHLDQLLSSSGGEIVSIATLRIDPVWDSIRDDPRFIALLAKHAVGQKKCRAMNEFLQRLKQRKLVQWAVAYVAAAFALLQGIDIVAQQFDWPEGVRRGITLAMVVGFFVALVLAWYHGERGAQRVTGTELADSGAAPGSRRRISLALCQRFARAGSRRPLFRLRSRVRLPRPLRFRKNRSPFCLSKT